jgi:hypothetical protein
MSADGGFSPTLVAWYLPVGRCDVATDTGMKITEIDEQGFF